MNLKGRTIQQYKLLIDSESDEIGQFVFLNDDTDTAAGFISDTNGVYLQVTLFEPVAVEILPPMIFDLFERVDAMFIFDALADTFSDEILDEWRGAILESCSAITH